MKAPAKISEEVVGPPVVRYLQDTHPITTKSLVVRFIPQLFGSNVFAYDGKYLSGSITKILGLYKLGV